MKKTVGEMAAVGALLLALLIYVTGRPSLGGLIRRFTPTPRPTQTPSPEPTKDESDVREEVVFYSARLENQTSLKISYDFGEDSDEECFELQPGERVILTAANARPTVRFDNDLKSGFQTFSYQLSPAVITSEDPEGSEEIPLYAFVLNQDGVIVIQATSPNSTPP